MHNVVIACEDIFGVEIYSILKAINRYSTDSEKDSQYNICGYISDIDNPFGDIEIPIIKVGSISNWVPTNGESCVLGIKDPNKKQKAVLKLLDRGIKFETIIAPWVRGPMGLEIGEGSILVAYSCANGVHIGNYVTMISPMLSGHVIGDFSTIMRFSNVAGDVGAGVYIGNHVFVPLGKKIGDNAFVEDGSIVSMSVKPGTTVSGVPARKVKHLI